MFIPSRFDANTIFAKFPKEVAQSLASKKKLTKGLKDSTWKMVIRVLFGPSKACQMDGKGCH